MPAYEKFRRLGLCITCGQERKPGCIRCQPCLDKVRASNRKSLTKSKEAGLCNGCGVKNDNLPHNHCKECSEKHAKLVNYHRKGLCLTCGGERLLGKKRCQVCLDKTMSCVDCGQPKEAGRVRCRPCLDKMAARTKANQERSRLAGNCTQCHKPNDNLPRACCTSCTKKASERRIQLKLKVFNSYGGPQCKCCGESILEFLTLDHVNNDGAKQRKEYSEKTGRAKPFGQAIFRLLRDQGFPPGYQCLCANCNFAKGLFGECPHERLRREKSS